MLSGSIAIEQWHFQLKDQYHDIFCFNLTMDQKSSSQQVLNLQAPRHLGQTVLQQTLKVESQSSTLLENFVTIASSKANEMMLSIFGDYDYKAKNTFSFKQKKKILNYLQAKVYTDNSQLADIKEIKFTDYDPNLLENLPENIQLLRSKILKAKTNIQSAHQSLQKIGLAQRQLTIRYLNQQAYEFDKIKYNSISWGMAMGAFINVTIYKRGSAVRKAALFLTFGHLMGAFGYNRNLNRYFDAVYPIFQKDAVNFSKEEQAEFKDWKPEGKAEIDE